MTTSLLELLIAAKNHVLEIPVLQSLVIQSFLLKSVVQQGLVLQSLVLKSIVLQSLVLKSIVLQSISFYKVLFYKVLTYKVLSPESCSTKSSYSILSKPQLNNNSTQPKLGFTRKLLCKPPHPTHHTNSMSAISQLLLTRF